MEEEPTSVMFGSHSCWELSFCMDVDIIGYVWQLAPSYFYGTQIFERRKDAFSKEDLLQMIWSKCSFIQGIFFEHLLYAGLCFGLRGTSGE